MMSSDSMGTMMIGIWKKADNSIDKNMATYTGTESNGSDQDQDQDKRKEKITIKLKSKKTAN